MRCDEGTEVGGRVADARLQVMCGLVLLATTAGAAAAPCVSLPARAGYADPREKRLTCRMGGKSSPAERAKKKKGSHAEGAEKKKALLQNGLNKKKAHLQNGRHNWPTAAPEAFKCTLPRRPPSPSKKSSPPQPSRLGGNLLWEGRAEESRGAPQCTVGGGRHLQRRALEIEREQANLAPSLAPGGGGVGSCLGGRVTRVVEQGAHVVVLEDVGRRGGHRDD